MLDPIVREQSLLDAIKAGAGFFADLVARIVSGLQGLVIAPLAFAFGCNTQPSEASKPVQEPAAVVDEMPRPTVDEGPKQLGLFNITFYYMVGEDDVFTKRKAAPPENDNEAETELASIAPPEKVTIYEGKQCEPIAEVTRDFAYELQLQGTGKLKDGRVVNVWGNCKCERSPCFRVMSQQWGTGGGGRSLTPFRTVAVDPKLIKLGSLLYVPLLEGRVMPGRAPWGGFVHDGCVVADDTGGGIKGADLDLFVGKRGWYVGMAKSGRGGSHAWARHVPVYEGTAYCERKNRQVAKKTGAI